MYQLWCLLNTLEARKTNRAEIGMGRPVSAEPKFVRYRRQARSFRILSI